MRNPSFAIAVSFVVLSACGSDQSNPNPTTDTGDAGWISSQPSTVGPLLSRSEGSEFRFHCFELTSSGPIILPPTFDESVSLSSSDGGESFTLSVADSKFAFGPINRLYLPGIDASALAEYAIEQPDLSARSRVRFRYFASGGSVESFTLTTERPGTRPSDYDQDYRKTCVYGLPPYVQALPGIPIADSQDAELVVARSNESDAAEIGSVNTDELSITYNPRTGMIAFSVALGTAQFVGGTGSVAGPGRSPSNRPTSFSVHIRLQGTAEIDPETGAFNGEITAKDRDLEIGSFSGSLFGDGANELGFAFLVMTAPETAEEDATIYSGVGIAIH